MTGIEKLHSELNEMYRRANEWEKPYAEYPYLWTRESSRIACPLLARIIKLIDEESIVLKPKTSPSPLTKDS
jgi:hypothetical protein